MAIQDSTLTEKGYPLTEPPPPGQSPPGGGHYAVPHFQQFSAFLNYVSRTYYWTHDEALRDSACNAEAMWRDAVISTAVRERQRPVVQLEWQLEPRNSSDPQEKHYAQVVTEILEDIPRFQQFRRHLLDAIWKGRSGIQCAFAWDYSAGDKRVVVRDWVPIDGDSLVFKFDGTVGLLVNSMQLGQPYVERIESRSGAAKFPPPFEQQALIVHEFEPEPASYFNPEMAGSVHGSGYRGRVYFYWWLKQNLQKILFDFLRKVGNGFFLAGFAAGKRDELEELTLALEKQSGQPIIYVPVGQDRTLEQTLMHLPVNLSGSDMQWTIINALNKIIRDAILGQGNANASAASGIGGGASEHQGINDDERVKYDAKDLDPTLQKVVNVIYSYIAPGVRPARFQHLTDKKNPQETMESANWFATMGGPVPQTWAQEQLGIPDPKPGEPILGIVQNQQATSLASTPAGVPQAGTPGPEQMAGGGQAGQPAPAGADDAALAAQIQPA